MPEETVVTPEQTPAPRGPAPGSSTLDVDALVGRFFGSEDEGGPATATPEHSDEPHGDETDTPAGHQDPVEGALDTLGDVDEGEDTGVEDGGIDAEEPLLEDDEDPELDALLAATEEEDPEPEDTSKDESFLPEFDRAKFLKDHPELEAPYKHMQSAFSRKMAEASRVQKKADEVHQRASAMEKQYLAFQEHLKNDDTFEEFLVQVAISRPEVMDRAYERAVSLNEDEGKKKEYLRERELEDTKAKLKEKEEREQAQVRQQRTQEIVTFTSKVAKKLGLTGPGDLEVAEQFVANQILQNHADNGKRDISSEQIVSAVRRAAKALQREKENVRRSTRQEQQRQGLEAAKQRLREPRRPQPPRAGAAPAARREAPKRINHAPPKSALDSWIDEQLRVEE